MAYAYPFDPTGTEVTNKITGESQIISPPGWLDYYFIVPKAAPYFRDSLVVRHFPSNQLLVEGVDYIPSHRFHEASLATGKMVYGSITFFDKTLTGIVELSYQTIGGAWTIDEQKILQILGNATQNPRITTWSQIVDLPFQFPVINHVWNLDDMVGMSEIYDALKDIEAAILANAGQALQDHIDDKNNPHQVTKAQVGLGNVLNYGVADLPEAQAGTANNKYMTPLRVRQAIEKYATDTGLAGHITDYNNPHKVTKMQTGLGNVENYPIATLVQATTGTDHASYMTPLRVQQAIQILALGDLASHKNDFNNPHQVTKTQVGLGNVENFALASLTEATAGALHNRYMTPLRVRQAIDAQVKNDFDIHVNNTNNPHNVTKAQVGLSQVENYPVAIKSEAEAGTANDRYMTPLRVKEAIAFMSDNLWLPHVNNTNNPHMVTKAQVGLGNVDNFSTAAPADVALGTSETLFVTPKGVKDLFNTIDTAAYTSHINNINNPHMVTKAQVGLGSVQNYGIASKGDAEAGASNTVYMTPLRVKEAIDQFSSSTGLGGHLTDYNNPHQVTAAQVNAFTKTETTALLDDKLNKTDQAEDSKLLDGKSYTDLVGTFIAQYKYPASNQTSTSWTRLVNLDLVVIGKTADNKPIFNEKDPILFTLAGGSETDNSLVEVLLNPFNLNQSNSRTMVGNGNGIELYQRLLKVPKSTPVEADPDSPLNFDWSYEVWNTDQAKRGELWLTPMRYLFADTIFDIGSSNELTAPSGLQLIFPLSIDAGDNPHIAEFDIADVADDPSKPISNFPVPVSFGEQLSEFETIALSSDGTVMGEQYDVFAGKQFKPSGVLPTKFGEEGKLTIHDPLQVFDQLNYVAVSPHAMTHYAFEIRMSNTTFHSSISSPRGFGVGVCLAHLFRNGKSHGLYAYRTDGGIDGKGLFVVGYNLFQPDEELLFTTNATFKWGDGITNTSRNQSGYTGAVSAAGGIYGTSTPDFMKFSVEKRNGTIKIKTTEFGNNNYTSGIETTLVLSNHPALSRLFSGSTQWGLAAINTGPLSTTRIKAPGQNRAYYAKGHPSGDQAAQLITDINEPNIRRFEVSGIDQEPYVTHAAREMGNAWFMEGGQKPNRNSRKTTWKNRLIYSPTNGKLYVGRADGGLRHLLIDADSVNGETVITP